MLKRYLFLTEEERRAADERVREVRRKGSDDAGIVALLAAKGEGQRVVVAKAPKGGLKGRIGVVRGIDAMGVARVGELEEVSQYLSLSLSSIQYHRSLLTAANNLPRSRAKNTSSHSPTSYPSAA